MAWGKAQFFDPLAKTIGGVRAELSDEEKRRRLAVVYGIS